MKPSIYINPEGIVCYIAHCPEEPKISDFSQYEKSLAQLELKMREYNKALTAAKASAVRFEDQTLSRTLCYKFGVYPGGEVSTHRIPLPIPEDSIHPFPSEKYIVEIEYQWRPYDTEPWRATNPYYYNEPNHRHKRQVAVLSPVQKEESQEELWLEVQRMYFDDRTELDDLMQKFNLTRKEGLL